MEKEKYTPENVWQFIQELGESMKELRENIKDTDSIIKELSAENKETDRRMQETDRMIKELSVDRKEIEKIIKELSAENKETGRIVKEQSKQIGGISESNGKFAEQTIYNALEKDKNFAGIIFDNVRPTVPIVNKNFETVTDIDVLMLNGDTIALIEVKYKVDKKDVKKLIFDTVAKFKEHFPTYNNYKILLGVGGMSFDKDAIDEAKENGIGIIKVIGDKVEYHTEGIKMY